MAPVVQSCCLIWCRLVRSRDFSAPCRRCRWRRQEETVITSIHELRSVSGQVLDKNTIFDSRCCRYCSPEGEREQVLQFPQPKKFFQNPLPTTHSREEFRLIVDRWRRISRKPSLYAVLRSRHSIPPPAAVSDCVQHGSPSGVCRRRSCRR